MSGLQIVLSNALAQKILADLDLRPFQAFPAPERSFRCD
jgi:hypothetical protein